MTFYVTANLAGGGTTEEGMSGADRIALACISKWIEEGEEVKVFLPKTGLKIFDRQKSNKISFIPTSAYVIKRFTYIRLFIFEILALIGGSLEAFKARSTVKVGDIVYSSSDFWPDAFPALLLKLIRPRIKWIAGFYLFAPRPWDKESPYKNKNSFVGFIYWLGQQPVYWCVKKWADLIFVTSEPDVARFCSKTRTPDKILVIRGGVDVKASEAYLNSREVSDFKKRKYDACFIARFHYQKGVLEIIEIWGKVVRLRPGARLAMIGNGPLEPEAKSAIQRFGLEKNIDLFGFLDGEQKFEIFKDSKMVVHPATYDSGGMAAAEAMAWGLPAISFDLEALKTYYPKGMMKVKCFDLDAFAKGIVRLLEDERLYHALAKEAVELIREQWDWNKRLQIIYNQVNEP